MSRPKKQLGSESIYQIPAFAEVIKDLEENHIYKIGLAANADINQRALKQAMDQGFEEAIKFLRKRHLDLRAKNVESTYTENQTKE